MNGNPPEYVIDDPESEEPEEETEEEKTYNRVKRTAKTIRNQHKSMGESNRQPTIRREERKSQEEEHIRRLKAEEAEKNKLLDSMAAEGREMRRLGWHYEDGGKIRWLARRRMIQFLRKVFNIGGGNSVGITLPNAWIVQNKVKVGDVVLAEISVHERAKPKRSG